MQALRLWSFVKVLVVSGSWVLFCLLVAVAWILFQFRGCMVASRSGSAGIGAVSGGLNVFMLAIPLAPPIVLIVMWLLVRWS
jgi:hypothetical protein